LPDAAPILPTLVAQTRAEFLRLWRQPAFSVPSLLLPLMFFSFFGIPRVHQQVSGVAAGPYLLASFGAVSLTSVMLFSFGVGVAAERAGKLDVLMRVAPLRPWVHLSARVLTALAFGALTLTLLFSYGAAFGVRQPPMHWLMLGVSLLLGALPFLALGYAIGYLASANAAAPIVNLIWAPLSFGSGLFVPLDLLPRAVKTVAPFLPSHRYAELAWSVLGVHTNPNWQNIAWLTGYGSVFVIVSLVAFRRDQRRKFA
jgi:ABC-2 type transport system permease protein